MRRRTYLSTAAASIGLISGCSADDSETSSTPTDTSTATDTPTPTPSPTPTVADAGLLLERDQYEDFDRQIESVGQGGEAIVGVEFDIPTRSGGVQGLAELTIFDEDEAEIVTNTTEVNTVVTDGSAVAARQWWSAFDTSSWDLGRYTAEIAVNSRDYGTTTVSTMSFDVVEPLGPGEVELELVERPPQIVARREFDWTYVIRNTSDRDSSVVSETITLDNRYIDPVQVPQQVQENVPANGETRVEETDVELNSPAQYTYRIDSVEAEFSFYVAPPDDEDD